LNTTNNCIFIRNHDELLLHWLKDNKDNLLWYKHGGEATVMKKTIPQKQLHIDFLLSLEDYYLDKKPPVCSCRVYQYERRVL
jgi:serine/threonine protein phosphatase 1